MGSSNLKKKPFIRSAPFIKEKVTSLELVIISFKIFLYIGSR